MLRTEQGLSGWCGAIAIAAPVIGRSCFLSASRANHRRLSRHAHIYALTHAHAHTAQHSTAQHSTAQHSTARTRRGAARRGAPRHTHGRACARSQTHKNAALVSALRMLAGTDRPRSSAEREYLGSTTICAARAPARVQAPVWHHRTVRKCRL